MKSYCNLSACSDGTYGGNCSKTCGKCSTVCNKATGECPSGCQTGYIGDMCDTG